MSIHIQKETRLKEAPVRKQLSVILLLLVSLTLGLSAAAADQATNVAGNWQLSWKGRQGTQQSTLKLQQDGSKLTGTMEGSRGSAPLTGSIQGNEISFTVQFQGENRTFSLAFTGTADADKMSGTFQPQGGGGRGGRRRRGGQGQQADRSWTATRQTEHPSQPSEKDQPDQPQS
jgi:hypothetical protein